MRSLCRAMCIVLMSARRCPYPNTCRAINVTSKGRYTQYYMFCFA
jgi:hypothetical protein